MYIAIDDTDSPKNMCTTFILTEIIKESKLDVIGLPRLVRLNPTIPFRTRGNASLCVNLGKGKGMSEKIGKILGKDIISYESGSDPTDVPSLLELAKDVILRYADLSEENTNPGLVVSKRPFDPSFYWKVVRDVSSIDEAEKFIKNSGAEFSKIKNGRGIIGAAAAISWPGLSKTYELLFYKEGISKNIPSELKFIISRKMESIPGTFNNIDVLNRHPAIFPDQSTPVIMGVRSVRKENFLEEVLEVPEVSEVKSSRYMLYETNQATDDHIITDFTVPEDYHSYRIEGSVSTVPVSTTGSHYFAEITSGNRRIKIAAFEPTKEFRKVFGLLRPGDLIVVYGSMKRGTINVEKMEIKSLARAFARGNPECTICGNRTLNKGMNDYRCPRCGNRMKQPHYRSMERELNPGFYDVPVSARRHLSMPFSLNITNIYGGRYR